MYEKVFDILFFIYKYIKIIFLSLNFKYQNIKIIQKHKKIYIFLNFCKFSFKLHSQRHGPDENYV